MLSAVSTASAMPVSTFLAKALELQEKGALGCCQSNRNLSPIGRALPFPGMAQAMRFCHSVNAAERRVL